MQDDKIEDVEGIQPATERYEPEELGRGEQAFPITGYTVRIKQGILLETKVVPEIDNMQVPQRDNKKVPEIITFQLLSQTIIKSSVIAILLGVQVVVPLLWELWAKAGGIRDEQVICAEYENVQNINF